MEREDFGALRWGGVEANMQESEHGNSAWSNGGLGRFAGRRGRVKRDSVIIVGTAGEMAEWLKAAVC